MQPSLEANKKIVQEFYNFLINKKDFKSASKYIGNRYIQHNPLVAEGPEGLKALVDFLKSDYPDARSEIKRVFAEGDYVIIHVHSVRIPNTRGRAIFDLFRLEKGKIVEHWDAIQEIPESSANANGMF
jgi:predicted SnoaL-like aldol condensation-catalyzing enzyme